MDVPLVSLEEPRPFAVAPPPFPPPAPAVLEMVGPGRWFNRAVGQEMFGRPAGPWGLLFAPVPVGAALLAAGAVAAATTGHMAPAAAGRLLEIAWVGVAPFALAALGQSVGMAVAEFAWRGSRGTTQLDASPRLWHYPLAAALAIAPLVILQIWPPAVDALLQLFLWLSTLGSVKAGHVGYDPGWGHLAGVALFPLVLLQARHAILEVPPRRLLGLQRELARLRGAVTWQQEAWTETVEETVDKWLADLAPPPRSAPAPGERARRHRVRYNALRKELIACWIQVPPDLAGANRALLLYRQGW